MKKYSFLFICISLLYYCTACNNSTRNYFSIRNEIINDIPDNLNYHVLDTSYNDIDVCYWFMNRPNIFSGSHYTNWNTIENLDTISNYVKIYKKEYGVNFVINYFEYIRGQCEDMNMRVVDIHLSEDNCSVKLISNDRNIFIYKKSIMLSDEYLEIIYEAIDLKNGIDVDYHLTNSSFLDKYGR